MRWTKILLRINSCHWCFQPFGTTHQPGVEPEIVKQIVTFWQKDVSKIVLTNYQGRKSHPMIFLKELFPLLEDLHGDKAVWKLVDQRPDWVREVPIDRRCLREINTWEDYQAILST